jgi:hypothetical protein
VTIEARNLNIKTILLNSIPLKPKTYRKEPTGKPNYPPTTTANMPLVVPGLTNNSGENDKTNNWMNQLMGKKIGDTSNETVSPSNILLPDARTTRCVEELLRPMTDLRQNRAPQRAPRHQGR